MSNETYIPENDPEAGEETILIATKELGELLAKWHGRGLSADRIASELFAAAVQIAKNFGQVHPMALVQSLAICVNAPKRTWWAILGGALGLTEDEITEQAA